MGLRGTVAATKWWHIEKVLNSIVGKQQEKEGAQTESDIYITWSDLERELLNASHHSIRITFI